ncbi:hypothetical protein RA307_06710 [Xanthobacteraceae bacterium Astr-EGSB]|uniref:hypothetical protein n=1 Tax=Astrobacterium formosum TaxID=3069710 RepID=UPI0027B5850E|nr:hypothetical protein [Xanthobacteraceae bacterium Astr-EGSB]
MPDLITPARVAANAEGSRIVVAAETPVRVAAAALPTFSRYAAADIAVPFEVEPASFVVVQGREIGR